MKTTQIFNGSTILYEHAGRYDDICCSCGLVHTILVKVRGRKAYIEVFRNDHLTAKERAKRRRRKKK